MQLALQKQQNKKKTHLESLAADGFSLRGNRIRADGGILCSRFASADVDRNAAAESA